MAGCGVQLELNRDAIPVHLLAFFEPVNDNIPAKNLTGIPWRVAFALQADGWYLRSAMPWIKRNSMPESVTDRPTSALEYVFLLTKSSRYFFDMEAVRKQGSGLSGGACFGKVNQDGPGSRRLDAQENDSIRDGTRSFRNTDLWFQSIEAPYGLVGVGDELVGIDVTTTGYPGAHFATFPPDLIEPLLLAGTSERGCCAKCGAPWKRETEREPYQQRGDYRKHAGESGHNNPTGKTPGSNTRGMPYRNVVFENWSPSCACDDLIEPCTILDPFGGSGTTAAVAQRLGLRSILIELNESYCKLAADRFKQRSLLPL